MSMKAVKQLLGEVAALRPSMISQTVHPQTKQICYFVHPCNTANLIDSIISTALEQHGSQLLDDHPQIYLRCFISIMQSYVHLPDVVTQILQDSTQLECSR
uniref:Uncharacterized protein n=1 Tax=Spongospora subterranea TaxID=70186 RepID=A0A0H5QSX2_9EUKA|eukprot:CRZ04661.1 hypothetical protein [Spongospora subterranea]